MGKRAAGLRKARALISDPSKWTKNANARDKKGFAVSEHSARAEKFCVAGACLATGSFCEYFHALRDVAFLLDPDPGAWSNITSYNDDEDRTHDEVLWLMDLTIAFAEV